MTGVVDAGKHSQKGKLSVQKFSRKDALPAHNAQSRRHVTSSDLPTTAFNYSSLGKRRLSSRRSSGRSSAVLKVFDPWLLYWQRMFLVRCFNNVYFEIFTSFDGGRLG
jgi:hypothetical protein